MPVESINPQQSDYSRTNPKLDDRFIQTIKGKEFVLYAGLLDLAHQHGLIKLEVEHLQFPTEENQHTAICKATAITVAGHVFTDVADADPSNVNSMIAPHILRMASTRAKARVLRDLCNIGFCCLEELGDISDSVDGDYSIHSSKRTNGNGKTKNARTHSSSNGKSNSQYSHPMSEAQRRAVFNLAQRRNISHDELNTMTQSMFQKSLDNLTSNHASQLIQNLQQSA